MARVQNSGALLAAFDISNQTGPSIHNQRPPSTLAFEDHVSTALCHHKYVSLDFEGI